MTDTALLRETIRERGLMLGFVADFLGITRSALYLKLGNNSEFKASEIQRLTTLLNLTPEQQTAIFFNPIGD